MDTNIMELNMNEMEMVNGGSPLVAGIIGAVFGAGKGALAGGTAGMCIGGPAGLVIGAVTGGLVGGAVLGYSAAVLDERNGK